MKLIIAKCNGKNIAFDRSDHPTAERLMKMFVTVAKAEGYSDDELAYASDLVLRKPKEDDHQDDEDSIEVRTFDFGHHDDWSLGSY